MIIKGGASSNEFLLCITNNQRQRKGYCRDPHPHPRHSRFQPIAYGKSLVSDVYQVKIKVLESRDDYGFL